VEEEWQLLRSVKRYSITAVLNLPLNKNDGPLAQRSPPEAPLKYRRQEQLRSGQCSSQAPRVNFDESTSFRHIFWSSPSIPSRPLSPSVYLGWISPIAHCCTKHCCTRYCGRT